LPRVRCEVSAGDEHSAIVYGLLAQVPGDHLVKVPARSDNEQFEVPTQRAYPLERAVEALEQSEHGHVRSRLVLNKR
jgi:hypothetical protein